MLTRHQLACSTLFSTRLFPSPTRDRIPADARGTYVTAVTVLRYWHQGPESLQIRRESASATKSMTNDAKRPSLAPPAAIINTYFLAAETQFFELRYTIFFVMIRLTLKAHTTACRSCHVIRGDDGIIE